MPGFSLPRPGSAPKSRPGHPLPGLIDAIDADRMLAIIAEYCRLRWLHGPFEINRGLHERVVKLGGGSNPILGAPPDPHEVLPLSVADWSEAQIEEALQDYCGVSVKVLELKMKLGTFRDWDAYLDIFDRLASILSRDARVLAALGVSRIDLADRLQYDSDELPWEFNTGRWYLDLLD